ncbi:hypothetical protein PMKS-000904 [Pichia membranifaciens]|uniref:Uncharacterized protein n=1 Tax=Pichia membranifaciens TaxID=4926 RepID=A0A1Q2YCY4_9ASCO|nr:hypothetical protein PMKS-000904 [Pichia membranifaciens]
MATGYGAGDNGTGKCDMETVPRAPPPKAVGDLVLRRVETGVWRPALARAEPFPQYDTSEDRDCHQEEDLRQSM